MNGALVIAVLTVLGGLLARDMLRLSRWSPALFRSGPVVLKESRTIANLSNTLPTPFVASGWFQSAQYREIGPGEAAFIAPVLNAPMLLGRLIADPQAGRLSMEARPYWSLHAMFFFGFALAGFPWPPLATMAVAFTVHFVVEARQFRKVFEAVATNAAGLPELRR